MSHVSIKVAEDSNGVCTSQQCPLKVTQNSTMDGGDEEEEEEEEEEEDEGEEEEEEEEEERITGHPAKHCNRSNQRVRSSVCKSAAERVGTMEQVT